MAGGAGVRRLRVRADFDRAVPRLDMTLEALRCGRSRCRWVGVVAARRALGAGPRWLGLRFRRTPHTAYRVVLAWDGGLTQVRLRPASPGTSN